MQKLDKLDLHLLGFPTDNDETPTTAISTLPHLPTPLPFAEPDSWYTAGNGIWERQNDMEAAPKAPLLKDYDSFTEGTGKGSFESLLDEYPCEQGDLFYHPNSLELLPSTEPAIPLSIEMWREQVAGDIPERDEDPVQRVCYLSDSYLRDVGPMDALGSGDPVGAAEYGPRSLISPPVSSIGSPRAMKRTRSDSPEPSRRIRARARSKSLSSIKSLTFQILHGLTSAPPWRVNGFGHLPPFD